MEITPTLRQAKLKPERADRYPTLPARMWTSASWMAALVASSGGEPPRNLEEERTLSEADFEFRAGCPAGRAGLSARTRLEESVFRS